MRRILNRERANRRYTTDDIQAIMNDARTTLQDVVLGE